MRILHVIYDDVGNPWLGGGGAVRTQEIYSRIAGLGHRVTVLCGNYPGATRIEKRRGVTYRRTGLTGTYALSRLSFMLGAARLLKAGGYDIVVEDVSPYSPVGAPLWVRAGVPTVASVQNLAGGHATSKYGLAGWGPRLVEKPLLSRFRNFIAVSPGIARQLRRRLGGKIAVRVVPNAPRRSGPQSVGAVREPPLHSPKSPGPYSGLWTSDCGPGGSDAPYILFLGRIDVYQKGLDRLLAAFDLVAARRPEVKLVIAGGGTAEQERKLRSLVAGARYGGRVESLGAVGGERAEQLMRGALLLAMPSRYEAWPLTALEAAAAGTPLVGSDIVGVKDAAPAYPAAHGVLVPQDDTRALAEAFLSVAADATRRAELGARGQQWAKRFTWDALARDQLGFYESVMRNTLIASLNKSHAERPTMTDRSR